MERWRVKLFFSIGLSVLLFFVLELYTLGTLAIVLLGLASVFVIRNLLDNWY